MPQSKRPICSSCSMKKNSKKNHETSKFFLSVNFYFIYYTQQRGVIRNKAKIKEIRVYIYIYIQFYIDEEIYQNVHTNRRRSLWKFMTSRFNWQCRSPDVASRVSLLLPCELLEVVRCTKRLENQRSGLIFGTLSSV